MARTQLEFSIVDDDVMEAAGEQNRLSSSGSLCTCVQCRDSLTQPVGGTEPVAKEEARQGSKGPTPALAA